VRQINRFEELDGKDLNRNQILNRSAAQPRPRRLPCRALFRHQRDGALSPAPGPEFNGNIQDRDPV
jgi:hypothetical protein